MTCSVVTKKSGVPVLEMKDGELAVVVEWPQYEPFVGKAIQRCRGRCLIVLGVNCEDGRFEHGHTGCHVRILHSGDTFRID